MLVDVVRLGLHTLYYKVQTEWFTLVGGSLPQDITYYGRMAVFCGKLYVTKHGQPP